MPLPSENGHGWLAPWCATLALASGLMVPLPNATADPTPAAFAGITRLGDGSLRLDISATPGTTYFLQCTSNWANWTELAALTATSSSLQFTDSPAPPDRQRYYRLQNAVGTNSPYWLKAQETHNYVVGNLLTTYNSYRNQPGSGTVYEWYSVSQIYADAAMVGARDSRYAAYMNNGYAWMSNLWDSGNLIGGYFSAGNIDGSGQGGGKYIDDNSLSGNVYLDAYAITSGTTRTNYLQSARAIANWLMFSGQWDTNYGGGFWWSDSKTVKPTQSNGLALQLFLRLYGLTGQTYYRDWANSIKNWLETQMFDPSDGLYIWQIETNGVKNYIKFTYDNAIMIEADLLYAQVLGDPSYVNKAETLANKLNARLWNNTYKAYYFNTSDGRVNPCWCGWASQSLIRLYQADTNSVWLNYAQGNIDFMNAHLRNSTNGVYYTFCNMDGSNRENRIEGVDQAWMQRIQGLLSSYR